MQKISYDDLITSIASLVNQRIHDLLPQNNNRLTQAMHYSALSPGKRLRPFILFTTSQIWKVDQEHALRVAAVLEIIHSYSLIHDDLPAMDNDDYRRGMPSCHKKFDEAAAILAGDALLTLAFEILADEKTHPDSNIRCELIKILSSRIGTEGIAGGQMLDLIYEKEHITNYDQLVNAQYMKTAKLFMACCEMGAALGYASAEEKLHLSNYAKNFGLAFQFIDDLADINDNKPLNNNNIVKLIGKEHTLEKSKEFIEKAHNEISFFKEKGELLSQLAYSLLDPPK
ncbi:MAG: polyprenyl synthetase family protein [Rickettsiales bacterium]